MSGQSQLVASGQMLPAAHTQSSITEEVGPYCGTGCDMWTTVNGISYRALNELAYGYYWSSCPNGTSLPATACQNWFFLDANTGKLITGALPRLGGPGPTESSY